MSVNTPYHGITYPVPETKEKGWGPTVTALIIGFCKDLDALSVPIGTGRTIVFPFTATSVSAGGTVTQATAWHRLNGGGSPVTLSATTAIANGIIEGAFLLLSGSANTVTILHGANTTLNGDATLGLNDFLALVWNDADSSWWEVWRNN
jgi:hypothetical protein